METEKEIFEDTAENQDEETISKKQVEHPKRIYRA